MTTPESLSILAACAASEPLGAEKRQHCLRLDIRDRPIADSFQSLPDLQRQQARGVCVEISHAANGVLSRA